jgi:lantibiotic modifying enzyme
MVFPSTRRTSSPPSPTGMSSDGAFLEASAAIGRRIVADAVWHDGRCNWVGAVADGAHSGRALYRALGPDVYGGTAGVGLFLAQLAAVTAEADVRRTAVGALRHAVEHAASLPPARRDGLHGGPLGVAWAAACAGALLDEEELHAGGHTALTQAGSPSGPDRCPDVATGIAGSILALVALGDVFADRELIRDAVDAGDELIRRARVTRHGWSWADPGRRHPRDLCGLAHGAAGIGWSLLELFAATGEERFHAAGIGAFAYEQSWLDPASGTWPDLRIGGQQRAASKRIASPALGAWCHGEGGIALTCLRAAGLVGEDACVRDGEVALETTGRFLAAAMPHEVDDLSLCHGAAGAADVLLCGARASGEPAELALELGRVALDRYGAKGNRWPCGARGETTPGLFRGHSGIAWWFLRLHDPAIPSPLILPIRG